MTSDLEGLWMRTRLTTDGEHALIEVGSPVLLGDDATRSDLLARRRAAGVLARIAASASDDLEDIEESTPHGCSSPARGWSGSSCYVQQWADLLRPGPTTHDSGDTPLSIGLSVPTEQAQVWLDRIQGYLAAVADDDAAIEPAPPSRQPGHDLSTRNAKEPT